MVVVVLIAPRITYHSDGKLEIRLRRSDSGVRENLRVGRYGVGSPAPCSEHLSTSSRAENILSELLTSHH